MESEERYGLGSLEALTSLLRSFNGKEPRKRFDPLMAFYQRRESEYFSMVANEIDEHCRDLHEVIQRFHG
jgi:hypothetical protein